MISDVTTPFLFLGRLDFISSRKVINHKFWWFFRILIYLNLTYPVTFVTFGNFVNFVDHRFFGNFVNHGTYEIYGPYGYNSEE